jgi:hypothetical protein
MAYRRSVYAPPRDRVALVKGQSNSCKCIFEKLDCRFPTSVAKMPNRAKRSVFVFLKYLVTTVE